MFDQVVLGFSQALSTVVKPSVTLPSLGTLRFLSTGPIPRSSPQTVRIAGSKLCPSPPSLPLASFYDALLGFQMSRSLVAALPSGSSSKLVNANRLSLEVVSWTGSTENAAAVFLIRIQLVLGLSHILSQGKECQTLYAKSVIFFFTVNNAKMSNYRASQADQMENPRTCHAVSAR